MKIRGFQEAENYLLSQIDDKINQDTSDQERLARAKHFFKLLGNPQKEFKTVHVAGTSGKTSTAYYIYQLLYYHRFKVGLTISPHFVDIRERVQINGSLIDKKNFSDAVNFVFPFIEKMKKTKFGKASYFEAMLGVAFYIFAQEKVDYAVVETGIGGRFDATNAIAGDKLCVITKIGMDHMNRLGETLSEIAIHKAGIIDKENVVISAIQEKGVMEEIKKNTEEKAAKLIIVNEENNLQRIRFTKQETQFDFQLNNYKLKNIRLGQVGKYQIENAGLALVAVSTLAKRDGFLMDEYKTRKALREIKIKGRFEVISYKDREIVLDAAHNAQKIKGLADSLIALFPNEKFVFILPFKTTSEKYLDMLKEIKDIAQVMIVTRMFTGGERVKYLKLNPQVVKKRLGKIGIERFELAKNTKEAIEMAFKHPQRCRVVATGSLFIAIEALKTIEK